MAASRTSGRITMPAPPPAGDEPMGLEPSRTAAAASKQGVMSIALRDRNQLHQCFMPFLKHGGLFIPTDKPFELGDDVFLLLTLMDEPTRYPVTGKVVWLTPKSAIGGRPAGIGVQFNDTADGEAAKSKIEAILGATLNAERPTHTM